MSGVRVGSRLDQLLDLERQVKVQIEHERRTSRARTDPGPGTVPAAPVSPAQERPASCLVRVPLAAVAPAVVRDWAKTHGMPLPDRGPLAAAAVRAFVEAHS